MDSLNILLLVAVTACTVKVSLQGPNQRRLYKNLMNNYNPLERPVFDESDTLTVEFGLNLKQILDVDEKNQVLTTNLWIQMLWNDHYLQWNESDYPGVTNVHFPAHLLWKPDILLDNSADERFDAAYHTKVLVDNSGSSFTLTPGIFKSTCEIDVRWFPFDIQRCKLKFNSWTYDGKLLDLKMVEDEDSMVTYMINGEWELVEVTGKKNEIIYACCPTTPYPDITYTVVMRRRTLYYGLNLLIPCILISTLALLVFLLPADSGEKISLGITVLLSLTVLMLIVAQIIPATSDSVPVISVYFVTMMVIVGLSVIATVVVLQFHHHDPDKMPEWTRVFLLNWCAQFLRMKRPGEDRERPSCQDKVQWSSLTGLELNPSASVPQSTSGNRLYFGHYATAPTLPESGVLREQLEPTAGEDEVLLPKGQVSSVEPQLARIFDEVRYIAQKLCDQDEDKMVRNEWKFAASVIDRICLVAFSLVTFLCTMGILMLVCFSAAS